MNQPEARLNWVDRFLKLFADVQAGESRTVLLLTLNIFLILTAYYIIKPVREALIVAAPYGDQLKSYASAGHALLSFFAVRYYASLASRMPRRRLIRNVTLFFAANLVVFYIIIRIVGVGGVALGLGFFLWVGVFSLMAPAQFWSFANDVYSEAQGKRLFAIVAFGASAGAVAGAEITARLLGLLGVEQLLLISSGILLLGLLLTYQVREGAEPNTDATGEPEKQAFSKEGAFTLVWRNRYLLLIALLLLMTNWVNSTGEFILTRAVKEAAHEAAAQMGLQGAQEAQFVAEESGRFYARFFWWVNILGVSMQLFLVSRVIKYLGVRIALLVLPFIALGGYSILALSAIPALGLIRWIKTAENATDYSLQNTVRQTLFLPTTAEEKYKAKQAIDTFFVRAGDVLSALLVFVGANVLLLSTRGFAAAAVILVILWLLLAIRVGISYRGLRREEVVDE